MRKILVFISYICIIMKLVCTFCPFDFMSNQLIRLYGSIQGVTILLVLYRDQMHKTIRLTLLISLLLIWLSIIVLMLFNRKNEKVLACLFSLFVVSTVCDLMLTNIYSIVELRSGANVVNLCVIVINLITIIALKHHNKKDD